MTSERVVTSGTGSSARVSGTRKRRDVPRQHSGGFRGRRPNGRLLYILPVLLFPGFIRTFALGNFFESLAIVAGILCVVSGAYLVKRGIGQEAKNAAGKVVVPSRFPNKNPGAALYGAGIFLASAFVARYGVGMGLLYGLVTAAAVLMRYGTDAKPEKTEVMRKAERSGIDIGNLMKSLDEAKKRVQAIRNNGSKLNNRSFRDQTNRIADEAGAVIAQIEQDPRDIRSARKFLISYLKRAEEVTQRYADKQAHYATGADGDAITKKFAEALDDLETVFQEQNAKLLENDSLELEVKLDVLSQRLKSEGAG